MKTNKEVLATEHAIGNWTYAHDCVKQVVKISSSEDKIYHFAELCANGQRNNDTYTLLKRAQLISAAPELLKVLKHISERISVVRPNDAFNQSLKHVCDEIIKKATI